MAILQPDNFDKPVISDDDAFGYQSANNIRADAISVRTSAGSVVWVDPSATDVVKNYQTGVLTGDVNEIPPEGVIAKLDPALRIFAGEPIINLPPKPSQDEIVIENNILEETFIDKKKLPQFPSSGSNEPIIDGVPVPAPLPYTPIPPQPTYTPNTLYLNINIEVLPSNVQFEPEPLVIPWTLNINRIPLPLRDATIAAVQNIIGNKIANYFDQDRVGKTLLNFGQDYQALLTNWKYDEENIENSAILVKLYEPLPPEIDEQSELWISRELSPPYIDQIFVVFISEQGVRVYLRPPNKDVSVTIRDGLELNNVTQQTLFSTGSRSPTNLTDPIVEQWFVTSLEGAELNIDYSDFTNFVFYSSAVKRLEAFKQKMLLLEDYNSILSEQSASIAAATSASFVAGFTGSLAYAGYERISEQRIDLLRSFDGYERFLYYNSDVPYSSSFSKDDGKVDQMYYINDATWPKLNGVNISVVSASNASLYSITAGTDLIPEGDYSGLTSWWDGITFIANEYDIQNANKLSNNLPEYLRTDDQSDEFLTFVDMIGHQFDVLKVYTDAMPSIYDRNNDPDVGMSQDMVWNVASSFGIELPNSYAIKHLLDYTIGSGSVSPVIYREMAAETWKRFLHNQIYLLKTKGTKTALRGLMNTYGVLPTAIQIRESATPSFTVSQSYELIEEQTNVLPFTSGTHINIPFSSSVETVQVRFATTAVTQSILYNVGTSWGIRLLPVSGTYGRIQLLGNGGTPVTASSLFELYNGDYYTVTTQRNGVNASLRTQQVDETGKLVYSSLATGSLGTWYSGSTLFLGMSGTVSWGSSFSGSIDEVRLWSEALTDTNISWSVQYPGLYNGNTTTSARDSLLARLSFGIPRNLYSTSSVPNESPYIRVSGRSPSYNSFPAVGFSNETTYPYSMDVVTRYVLRYAPNVGSNQFVSNKIIIEDPAVLRYVANDSTASIPILSHEKSIVTLQQKPDDVLSHNTVGFYFSTTDAVNDSIIRSIGNIDLQSYFGDPSDLYESRYSDLDTLNDLYWSSYAYTYNYNQFVDFVQDLLQPMFIQAKSLVPARAKLLTGIVLESPILERAKIKWNPMDVSGYGTFDENVTPTFYPDAITSEPTTIDAEYLPLNAIYEQNIEEPLSATYDVLESELDLSVENTIESDIPSYYYTINMLETVNNTDIIGTDFIIFDDITSQLAYYNYLLSYFNVTVPSQLNPVNLALFNQLLAGYQPTSTVDVQTGMNPDMEPNYQIDTIEPYVDFLQIASTMYFSQMAGLVRVPTYQTVRIDQNILRNAGTWTKGTVYAKNDFVIQTAETGSASPGNGLEFVCIVPTSATNFTSYVAPYIDTNNWRRVQYTTDAIYDIKQATERDSLVQLVSPSGGYPTFNGYSRYHYRFHRDTRLGTRNHNWLGCLNTDSTTFDGGPAIEIIASAGDLLVVINGAEPIQRPDNPAGPRLDVK